jgi:hypothetical protein
VHPVRTLDLFFRLYASFMRRNSFCRLTAKALRRQEPRNAFLADLRAFAVAFAAALQSAFGAGFENYAASGGTAAITGRSKKWIVRT